ncbi:MAG: right-handed parallel beta-helix repeat-containing protein [Candidatus Aenigmarchaeota archaeon]|nr:right-handed parallel beta-helix repeat-containing protein [Candidatus Aenigmarchaeota archaeon]
MRVFLLVMLIVFFSLMFSKGLEEVQTYVNESQENSFSEKFVLEIKPYYFFGEKFSFNFSCNCTDFLLSLLDESLNYKANATENLTLEFPPGKYYLEANISGERVYLAQFEIIASEVKVYPRILFVNDSLYIEVRDYIGKNFEIIIEPSGSIYNFIALNETSKFSLKMEQSGNYTILIDNKSFEIEVLPYLNAKKELKIIFDEEKFFANKTINYKVSGSPHTEFKLSILRDVIFFQIFGATDENGVYAGNFTLNNEGNYTLMLEYDNTSKEYEFFVQNIEVKLEIIEMQKVYCENVSFLIKGSDNTDFHLYFTSGNYTKVYSLKTNSSGFHYFEDKFEDGKYKVYLIVEDFNESREFDVMCVEMKETDFIGDNSYVELSEDIFSDDVGLKVYGKNVTIKCNGRKIVSKIGINVKNSSDVFIDGCFFEKNYFALLVENSENLRLSNIIAANNSNGIIIKRSKNVEVVDSILEENDFYGLLFFNVENPLVKNTKVKTQTNMEVLAKLKD